MPLQPMVCDLSTCWRKFFILKVYSSTPYPIWFVIWHKLYVIRFYGALWKSLRYEWKWWRNHSKSHKSVVILYIATTTVYISTVSSKPLFSAALNGLLTYNLWEDQPSFPSWKWKWNMDDKFWFSAWKWRWKVV